MSPLSGKSLTANRDAGNLTSNAGLLALREAERHLQMGARMAQHIPDARDPNLVTHSYTSMVVARMMMIAAGYEDCDDIDALKRDAAFKIACERAPESGIDLMSQPTLSRLENTPEAADLYRIGREQIDIFIDSFKTKPTQLTLDFDDTTDLIHGGQQLGLFNSHAGGHCFQPMLVFEATTGKPVLALLRPGKRPSGEEIARVMWHVIHRIVRRWPKVRILVRADGHYGVPEVLNLLRKLKCDYILGLPTNKVLAPMSEPWEAQCAERHVAGGQAVRRFHQFQYAAGTWGQTEKVIARVEATDVGTDTRFIVTNLKGRGKTLYEHVYCARGAAENLIKDLKLHTRSDKTSCSRWQANQFRLFLHVGAYWLLHSVRLAAPKRSRVRTATFETIRVVFVKLACRVEELKHSIKLSFPSALPHADVLSLIVERIAARGS